MKLSLSKIEIAAHVLWDLSVFSVSSVFARELLDYRIPTSGHVRVFAIVVFLGIILQALHRLRQRVPELFRG